MSRKKLLIFIDWYYPAFKAGGPIKSVFNIASAFKEELDISIVTSAYDLDGKELLEGIEFNQWVNQNGVKVIYLKQEQQHSSTAKHLIQEINPDIIYFNSLFSRFFTLIPLRIAKKLGVSKIILAPRGMLGKAALEIKPLKKRLFISISRILGWFSSITWHVSSTLEEQEVRQVYGKLSDIVIAQNISSLVTRRVVSEELLKRNTLKLIFFSRINSKKNLKFAIDVMQSINSPQVSLDIYGPIEDESYWEDCKELMNNSSSTIAYKGLIHPKELTGILQQYHYLLFPTNHENYGHVIAESLCASLPVLISQNTPWRNLEKENVGFDLPLEVDIFCEKINALIKEEQYIYQRKVDAAFEYSNSYIVNEAVLAQNRKIFN